MAVLLLFCFFFTTTEFVFVFLVFLFTKWKVVTFVVVVVQNVLYSWLEAFLFFSSVVCRKKNFVFLILFLYV